MIGNENCHIKAILIQGLFGNFDVEVEFKGNALVIVGPNGVGKSTVLNIIYCIISKQWTRLSDYRFDSLELKTTDGQFRISHEIIDGLINFGEIPNYIRRILSSLAPSQIEMIAKSSINMRRELSDSFGISPSIYMEIRNYLRHSPDSLQVDFRETISPIEQFIDSCIDSRILYLPTYRRIEKDLNFIFPRFEEEYRRRLNIDSLRGRSAEHYVELVSWTPALTGDFRRGGVTSSVD